MSPKTPAEVANALSDALGPETPLSAAMIGLAAFTAASIFKFYPEPLRKQIIVTHANLIFDMIERVEEQEMAQTATEEVDVPPETKKAWVQ